MGKAVSRGQALQVAARVGTQINWDELDGDALQRDIISLTPEEFGIRFTAFLKNGGKLISSESKIIRPQPFDPAEFIDEKCKVWRGPAEGDGLKGEEDIDSRSLELTEINVDSLHFETCLKKGEQRITGEEKLKRLKASSLVRLGGNVFLGLWRDYEANKENSVLEYLFRTRKITYVDFFGLILRDPNGRRYVLYLYRDDDGRWDWDCHWLGLDWNVDDRSAVLASST